MPGGPPPGLDLLHYPSMAAALYPAGSQERLELEARERELRELRDREISDRIKQEIMKRPMNPLDGHPHSLSPHWMGAARFPGFSPPVSLPSGFPHSHGLYAPAPSVSSAALIAASERERMERLGEYPTFSLGHWCCHDLLSVDILNRQIITIVGKPKQEGVVLGLG